MVSAAERKVRRFVYTSSMEEPDLDDPCPVPCSPYSAAKYAASAYARMFHSLYQLPAVTLRTFMVYGPEQKDLTKLIPYVILSLLRGESPKLSSGDRLIDWIYVDDVIDAMIASAVAEGVEGKTIDVGSGEQISLRGIVEKLVPIVDTNISPEFGSVPDRPNEQNRVAVTEHTESLIGWKPRVSLDEGLKRTVDWYTKALECGRLPGASIIGRE